MAREVFSYSIKIGAQGPAKFRTHSVAFGDGYAQHAGDGLNNKVRSWSISKNGPLSELQPVMDFLDRHQGHKRFDWTPPFGGLGIFICKDYAPTAGIGTEVDLSATFEEVFQP